MKRLFSVFLALVLLCALCSGCAVSNPGPLRVCIDLGSSNDLNSYDPGKSAMETDVEKFQTWLDDCSKYIREGITSEEIEWEFIPSDETMLTEREAALQRIRTEIMTGGGPDVFLCTTNLYKTADHPTDSRLFPYVEKAILDGRFLPLDEYLSRAILTNPDDLWEPVMKAGQDRQGKQAVLPMTFTVNVLTYPREVLPEYDSTGKTWNDVLKGDDPVLSLQSLWAFNTEKLIPEPTVHWPWVRSSYFAAFPFLYPKTADFETGKLCFTEEELFHRIKENLAACRSLLENGEYQQQNCALSTLTCTQLRPFDLEQEITYIPLRNETGGTTARIDRWCAVNANTKQPDKAFEVIDALMSENYQKGGSLYLGEPNMPVNKKIGSPELPIHEMEREYFSAQQFEEYQRACGEIDAAYFPSLLEDRLMSYSDGLIYTVQTHLYNSFAHDESLSFSSPEVFLQGSIDDDTLSRMVHETYEAMQRLLDES